MKKNVQRELLYSRGSFKRFENCAVKLLAKETKWTLSEERTRPSFLETLISKSDFGPVKLPGLSRNGPQALKFMPYRKPALVPYLIIFELP